MEQVARAASLQNVYDSALTCLQDALAIERAALLVYDHDRVMQFAASAGISDRYRDTVGNYSPFSPDESNPAPFLVPDVRQQPELQSWLPQLECERIRAMAFIPVCFGPELLGTYVLHYRQTQKFSASKVATAEIIAGQFAFALEHHRVAGDLGNRLNLELEARQAKEFLADASRILTMTHEPDDTVRHLAHIVVPRLADWCVIQVVDEHGKIKPVEVAHRDPAKVDMAWQLVRRGAPYEHGTAVNAIRTGTSTLVSHIDSDMLAVRANDDEHLLTLESFGLNSGITVPLRARGRILGALTVMSAESRKVYDEQDVHFVEEIASWAALAIDNAELYRQTEDARAVAERARSRLQTLTEVHDDLASSLDPDAALCLLARRLVGTLADYCITYSFDGEAIRRLGMAHRDPEKLQYLETLCVASHPSIDDDWGASAAIRRGEAMLVSDVSQVLADRNDLDTNCLKALRALAPQTAMFVPLRARGHTVGAIALLVGRDSQHQFDADDLILAQELAAHAALMVDNARLYAASRTAIRARDDMIAVVSHDLRNPLQSIASAAAVLQLDPSRDRRSRSTAAISIATEQMDRLLRDLLDISRIDSGQFSVNREKSDVASLMKEARTLFYPLAKERSIRLNCIVAERMPAVYIDRGRISQVLSNLLGNALKFVPAGGRIDLLATQHLGRIRIAVTDTGAGIAAENLPKVFDRFWQADRRKERGAGLGLAVAKGIVQAHGGEIGVESCEGKGSTFYFMLDAMSMTHAETRKSGPQPGPILVVDDDEPFRTEIVELLQGSGYDVVSAGDSREALEFLEGESTPALVILDGMTPLMDGNSLYDAVKQVPRLASVPMVISSRLNELPADESSQGAAGYLDKPVRPSQLLGLAAALCQPTNHRNTRLN